MISTSRLAVIVAGLFAVACGTKPSSDDAGLPDANVFEVDAGSVDSGVDAGAPDAGFDAGVPDAGIDLDRDGLDDALEASLAQAYLPVLAVHPQDGCPLGGVVYRARKHPLDPTLVLIIYDYLLERDCGLTSHVGDDEVFSVTINPAIAPPAGITALRTISHQGTICERTGTCGTCGGLSACEVNGSGRPLVYFSKDKHGSYTTLTGCGTLTCLDQCAVGDRPGVPLVNAGEPSAHLTENLSDGGFITAANGWTQQSLFNFNPWGPTDFGGAGSVAGDLVDAAFELPACR